MTGLDLALDDLIEVAVVITNYDLEPVHDGFSIVIAPTERGMANMSDFVRAIREVRPSIGPWVDVARNYAIYANEGGAYDELAAWLKSSGR